MEDPHQLEVSDNESIVDMANGDIQNGVPAGPPLVFLREESYFGTRKPHYSEYIKHPELYNSIARSIDKTHITGLQRVNGLWRIYLDNLVDKATLITEGVNIRGRTIPVMQTNPFRPDYEDTTRIRVQNIPLSADDGMITRAFVLKGLDVISNNREKLRIDGKLTNCDTGDRIVTVKSSSLTEPLNRFMYIGKYKVKVIHRNQNKNTDSSQKCVKCLGSGHSIATCENDWVCIQCKQSGHKKGDCPINNDEGEQSKRDDKASLTEEEDDSESQTPGQSGQVSARADTTTTTSSTSSPVADKPAGKARDKKQKSSSEMPKGQTRLDKFVQSEKMTPHRRRSPSVTRSPVTPPERLHDKAKKSRPNRRAGNEND